MRAMTALKEATWPVHQRLEKRLAVKDRFSSLDLYQAHLARLGEMWQIFGTAVQAHCPTLDAIARAEAGAQTTFAALEDCLCE